MRSFKSIRENISQQELDQIEKFADRLFAKVGIDVEFTRHFIDRVIMPVIRKILRQQNLQDYLSRRIINMVRRYLIRSRCRGCS